MSLPDIFTLAVSLLFSGFAAWRIFDMRAPFRTFWRALVPQRRKKPKVDAITDMVQWKRARRLEDQQAWQKEFDLLAPPILTRRGEGLAIATGMNVRTDADGTITARLDAGFPVLEWTSSGWMPIHSKKLHPQVEVRMKWLMDAQKRDQVADRRVH